MPIGAARISFLALTATVAAEAEVIRKKKGIKGMNGADIDTAQNNFGGSSLGLDGTDDHLRVTANIDYSNPWTVECWFYTGSTATQNMIVKTTSSEGTEGDLAYNFRLNGGKLQYYLSANGSSWGIVSGGSSTNSYTTNAWNHAALSWDGSNYYMFLNGVQERSDASSTQVYDGGFDQIYVGGAEGSTSYFSGYIDEVRFSNKCRYSTDNFSVHQSTPFVNDDDTAFLAHFDNTNGVTRFFDDNGYRQENYRSDSYSSYLKLAVPFNDTNGVNDVAHNITGTGLSSAASVTQGDSATVDGGPYYGAYNSAEINSRDGTALVYTLPTSFGDASSATYVLECWVRASDASTNSNWCFSSADSGGRWLMGFNNSSSSAIGTTSYIGLGDSDWHHFAFVNDGGTKAAYVDGLYKGAWTSANTGFTDLHVGQFNNTDANDFQGQLQDLRVYIGTRKDYTGTSTTTKNFQLPAPILEITGTMPGVVGYGDVKCDTSRSKHGNASALFDGTGDYIRAFNVLDDFKASTAMTWECFFNVDSDTGSGTVAVMSNRTGGTSNGEVQMLFRNFDMKVQVNAYGTGAWNANGVGSALATDTWHHYAVGRDSAGAYAVWVNGTRVANGTGWTQDISIGGDGTLGIGAHADGTLEFNDGGSTGTDKGWIDEVRISASDVYGVSNTSITVPTAPHTPDTNDRLLLHFDNTLYSNCFVPDNGRGRAMLAGAQAGDANIDDTYFKFGTSALDLDGSGDYVTISDTSPFAFGDNDWTIEMFFRLGDTTGVQFLCDTRPTSTNGSYTTIYLNGTTLYYYRNGNRINTTVASGTWYHLAVVYESSTGNHKMYIDGTQVGSTYTESITYAASDAVIGYSSYNNNYSANAYIDEFRVSNSARYTADFTAPTESFQNDANTLALFHFDGTDGQDVFVDDNGTY